MATKDTSASLRTRRDILKGASVLGGGLLAAPFVSRMAFAAPVELTMLAWYGHAEPDVVAEFEAANNVKFKPKYYTGGDNMLALIAQSPPGTFDVIRSEEHTSELQSLMRISYAVFCLKKKNTKKQDIMTITDDNKNIN